MPGLLHGPFDTEVEHEERGDAPVERPVPGKGGGEGVVVATTRPETMLGDTGVAVNPKDERYRHLIGKTLVLPLLGREIPVVADEYVDMEFGTGREDDARARPERLRGGMRHGLETIRVMDDTATVNENGGPYAGLDRYEARKRIEADLDALGLLVKKKIQPPWGIATAVKP